MFYDIGFPSKNELVKLINFANGTTFGVNDLNIDSISAMGGPETVPNTSVTVTAAPGSGFGGTMNLAYTRLMLDHKFAIPDLIMIGSAADDTEILGLLAAMFGLRADEISLSGYAPTMDTYEISQMQMTALLGSFSYVGSITVNLQRSADPTVYIETLITVTELPGFEPG